MSALYVVLSMLFF